MVCPTSHNSCHASHFAPAPQHICPPCWCTTMAAVLCPCVAPRPAWASPKRPPKSGRLKRPPKTAA
eukprot:4001618-Lingulodinium_polyedra.AAC.1